MSVVPPMMPHHSMGETSGDTSNYNYLKRPSPQTYDNDTGRLSLRLKIDNSGQTTFFCCITFLVVLAHGSTEDDLPWWKTTTLYEIYPKSFKDSDGDGIGDLRGITQKAKYFKNIGVDSIWIGPINTSPMKDEGYDITDFKSIAPVFGTLEDFKELLKTYHELGIKVLVDVVVNHSSDQHPWFQKSLSREDPYTNYYVWDEGKIDPASGKRVPKNNWLSEFAGGDKSAWEWSEVRQEFFFHDFSVEQPSLNYRCPELLAEMEDMMKLWLDLGVDGFRLDAAKYLIKPTNFEQDEPPKPNTEGKVWDDLDHIYTQNNPEILKLLERWALMMNEYSIRPGGRPRALFVEVYNDLDKIPQYYGTGKTSHMQPFNFELLMKGKQSLRGYDVKKIIDDWMAVKPPGVATVWTIGNHDRKRVATRYGPEMVDGMNMLTAVLPGVRVVYYGEEIGMQDTFFRDDECKDDPRGIVAICRNPKRTPMQWDDSTSAGFSTNPHPWLHVNPNYWWLNVAAQMKAARSHLKVFKELMKIRRDPVLQRGDYKLLLPNMDTLIVVRSYKQSYVLLIVYMGSDITKFTSQNLFAPLQLDMDLQVAIASINYSGQIVGSILKKNFLKITMRPKSAVLLKTPAPSKWSFF